MDAMVPAEHSGGSLVNLAASPAPRTRGAAVVVRGRYAIKERARDEARHLRVGHHGGTNEKEMRIPPVTAHT